MSLSGDALDLKSQEDIAAMSADAPEEPEPNEEDAYTEVSSTMATPKCV